MVFHSFLPDESHIFLLPTSLSRNFRTLPNLVPKSCPQLFFTHFYKINHTFSSSPGPCPELLCFGPPPAWGVGSGARLGRSLGAPFGDILKTFWGGVWAAHLGCRLGRSLGRRLGLDAPRSQKWNFKKNVISGNQDFALYLKIGHGI